MHLVRFTGESGRIYDFRLFRIGDELPKRAGVYVFTKTKPDGKWGAIYFGETSDLSERFDDHDAMACIVRNDATHLGIHPRVSANARRDIEADLLASHQAPCNRR